MTLLLITLYHLLKSSYHSVSRKVHQGQLLMLILLKPFRLMMKFISSRCSIMKHESQKQVVAIPNGEAHEDEDMNYQIIFFKGDGVN